MNVVCCRIEIGNRICRSCDMSFTIVFDRQQKNRNNRKNFLERERELLGVLRKWVRRSIIWAKFVLNRKRLIDVECSLERERVRGRGRETQKNIFMLGEHLLIYVKEFFLAVKWYFLYFDELKTSFRALTRTATTTFFITFTIVVRCTTGNTNANHAGWGWTWTGLVSQCLYCCFHITILTLRTADSIGIVGCNDTLMSRWAITTVESTTTEIIS